MTTAAPTTSPPDWWEVDNFHIHVGAIDSGDIADTRTIDSNYLVLDEIGGVYPTGGFQYHFNFENIPGSVDYIRAIMEGRYDGHPGHDVRVYAWNYTIVSWVELDILSDSVIDISYAWADLHKDDYISGGQARIEFLHLTNGTAAHDLYIDQLILEDRSAFHTTVVPTTTLTTVIPTTLGPTTTLTTGPPTTPRPHNAANDLLFNCKANNFAGVLLVDTYITGVMSSPSYGMDDLELIVDTYITGEVPLSALYELSDLELIVETFITGWAVTNDDKKNWVGWSKIGEVDCTIDEVNDAGFKAMSWPGYVYQVIKLDKNVVVYGSGGVTLAIPVMQPMATFGFKEILNIGVKNKTAVVGDEFVHFFIDVLGSLYKLSSEGLERLGYEEFLLSLVNPVLTWDAAQRRLNISSGTIGYTYNEGALTGGYANLSGLYRVKDVLKAVSPGTVVANAVDITTDIVDFKRRGMKSIESMQFDTISDLQLSVAIYYRFKKSEDFSMTNWTPLNDEGVAHLKASGTEFKFRVRSKFGGEFDLSYIKVQYKLIDQRFTRDANNRRGELDDY